MKIFYDTETTGLWNERVSLEDPCQPRIVQLAAVLTDNSGAEAASFCVLVKARRVRGAAGHGSRHQPRAGFRWWHPGQSRAEYVLPLRIRRRHAGRFQRPVRQERVIHSELLRAGLNSPFASRKTFCMMKPMEGLCKLPGMYGKFKWPKLQEAHQHCFGTQFEKAHDALAAVRATARVWVWYQENVVRANGTEAARA